MSTRALCLAAVSLALGAGCGPYFDHLSLVPSTSPPLEVSLEGNEIVIPQGIAVAFTPLAIDDDLQRMEDVTINLVSTNASVLGLETSIEEGGFVMFGVNPGQAHVSVFIDGEAMGSLRATVTAQPAP